MAHSVRERLQFGGPQSLTTDELLAALWGSTQGPAELARRVIVDQGGLGELARAEVSELSQLPGVGRARAAQVVAAFELGRRVAAAAAHGRWTVRAPSDVNDRLCGQLCPLDREELHVLLLNAKNMVLRQVVVYRGNVSTAVVRIGELFRDAVRAHAAAIVIVHNHPSGDPEPSADDVHLTAEAIAAGRLLDVSVLDHIVIAADGYVSLRDRGVAFERR